MARQHDRCPVDYSCHLINQMQDQLDQIVGLDHVELESLRETLELIREINVELRAWGSEEATTVDKLNAELEQAFPYHMRC